MVHGGAPPHAVVRRRGSGAQAATRRALPGELRWQALLAVARTLAQADGSTVDVLDAYSVDLVFARVSAPAVVRCVHQFVQQ